MNKLFKKLFSRFPLVALMIVLMLAVPFAAIVFAVYFGEGVLSYYFPDAGEAVARALSVLSWLIVAVAVLHAANRDMVPETKIPWILCITVFNVFGVVIYILFSSHNPRRRERKLYAQLYRQVKSLPTPARMDRAAMQERMGHWAAVSESLSSSEPLSYLTGGTRTEYFSSGEKFFGRFMQDLQSAKKFIFLEYFILEAGKFWDPILELLAQKAGEGVEVRLMYDDVGSMGKVRAGYYKELCKMGINCVKFNPFVPVITAVHNNRDHRKIAVIDGKVAYTGGLNIADEYINETHPFGYWKDNAIRMEGACVRSFTVLFLTQFCTQKKRAEDFSPYVADTASVEGDGFVQPYGTGPVPLYQRHLGEDVYVNILNAAHDYVYITTPYLIIDYRMKQAMIAAAKRGVDVRIVTPHIPDKKLAFALTRSNYLSLMKGGVKIYEFTPGFVHAKTFLADDRAAVVGTINLDYRSFLYHYEDAVFLYGTGSVDEIKRDFAETFSVSALQTEEDAKRSVVWRWLCEIAKIFAPLF